jgi:hypothetical protein
MNYTLETVATFPVERAGNPTVTPDVKLIVAMFALTNPNMNVNAIAPNNQVRPFPDAAWAS